MQRETKGVELQLQMAQAARLNLRMQKELKLLLSDPPPGASFPALSNSDHHHSSLTSIDAVLQGPEGTVYSNGLFKIKIQIPERYPFQPPIVTFATPVYHPNIDNGGRICLDILNLPPKGMWQPSLNISTVLTSIGLLLSEPNPDDGLMHEASRDYKYNRQAFDYNARSMTEKYAQAGVTDIASGENRVQTHTSQSTSQTKKEGSVALAPICTFEHRKLSLDSQGCCNNRRDSAEELCKVPIHSSSKNHTGIGPLKEDSKNLFKYTGNSGKLNTGIGRYKMSPKVPVPSHGKSGNDSMSNQGLLSEIRTPSDSPECSLVQAGNISSMKDEGHVERSHSASVGKGLQSLHRVRSNLCRESDEKSQSTPQISVSLIGSARPQIGPLPSHGNTHSNANPPDDTIVRKGYCSTSISLKKRGLVGVMPSPKPLGLPKNHLKEDKENMAPFWSVSPQLTGQAAIFIPESVICCNETEKKAVTEAPKLYEKAVELPVEPLNQLRGSNEIVVMHPENLSSPHLKHLHPANDVRSGMKQLSVEVCDGKHAVTLPEPDAVIVLDSEDSDDENIPVRSKLSLARRCLSRKRKSDS